MPMLAVTEISWCCSCSGSAMASSTRLDDHRRLLGPAHVLEQHGELVAAHAEQHVGLAHRAADALGGDAQQAVAGVVAEAVVHALEIVQVEEQQRERPAGALGAAHRLVEVLGEAGAVRQAGERVVIRLVADALLLRGALALLLAQQAVVAREHELHREVDRGHPAEHRGEDRPLAALHARHQLGDVAVDLEHRLHRRGFVHVHRHVGREDVALGELAFPAVEALAVSEVARRIAVARTPEAGVRRLVLADLARIGGEHGQAIQVIDLDLDDRQAVGQAPQLVLERGDLGSAGERRAVEGTGALDELGVPGPDRVGEGLGQRDAGVGLAFDHRVEHQAAVEHRQRDDHGHQHRQREELRIAQEVEHRRASIRADPDARTRGLPETPPGEPLSP